MGPFELKLIAKQGERMGKVSALMLLLGGAASLSHGVCVLCVLCDIRKEREPWYWLIYEILEKLNFCLILKQNYSAMRSSHIFFPFPSGLSLASLQRPLV